MAMRTTSTSRARNDDTGMAGSAAFKPSGRFPKRPRNIHACAVCSKAKVSEVSGSVKPTCREGLNHRGGGGGGVKQCVSPTLCGATGES